jgi:hypothetical protein
MTAGVWHFGSEQYPTFGPMAAPGSEKAPRDRSPHCSLEKDAEALVDQHALSLHPIGGLRPHTTCPIVAEKLLRRKDKNKLPVFRQS